MNDIGTLSSRIRRQLACLILAGLTLARPSPAQEDAAPAIVPNSLPYAINDLTKRALRKELELQKFNLRYRLELGKRGKNKAWRYFQSQEANASLTMSGLIIPVHERLKHIESSKKLHRHTLEKGNVLGMTGQWIGAYGALIELLVTMRQEYQSRKEGFSQGLAKQNAERLKAEIDNLLAQRTELVNKEKQDPQYAKRVPVDELEGLILKDIRDMALNEFSRFHVGKTRYLAFQHALYLMDIAKNTVGAVGSLYGYRALHKKDRRYNQPAGVCTLVSGALIMGTPIASRLVGLAAAQIDKRYLKDFKKDCTCTSVNQLDEDLNRLKNLVQQVNVESELAPLLAAGSYDEHVACYRKQLALATRETRAGQLAATEGIGIGLFTGGTKLANGVLFTIAGYDYPNDGRMTNVLLGTGALIFLVGASVAVLENVRIQFSREINNHKLKKRNDLPAQVLNDRIKQLDAIEASL